jgi:hypothetical protein
MDSFLPILLSLVLCCPNLQVFGVLAAFNLELTAVDWWNWYTLAVQQSRNDASPQPLPSLA